MTESFRGRITEFRKTYIWREEEETIEEAKYWQKKRLDREQKYFLEIDSTLRDKLLELAVNKTDLNEVEWVWESEDEKDKTVRLAKEFLNPGVLITTNVILFDRLHLPVAGRYTEIPYGEEVPLVCPIQQGAEQKSISQFSENQVHVLITPQIQIFETRKPIRERGGYNFQEIADST